MCARASPACHRAFPARQARERNAALAAKLRVEARDAEERIKQQRAAAEEAARLRRDEADLERQGIKVALEALAAERRARAEALMQEETELARRIAEERSMDTAQKVEAVRAALGRRMLDAEEAASRGGTSPVGARHTPSRFAPNSALSHAAMSDEEVERRLAEQRAAKLQREQAKRTASAWPAPRAWRAQHGCSRAHPRR